MRRIPHLRVPVRPGPRGLQTVDQDSFDDIAQSVLVLLRTRPGEQLTAPRFGLPDPTFLLESELDTGVIEAIQEHEPRAELVHIEAAIERMATGEVLVHIERSDG